MSQKTTKDGKAAACGCGPGDLTREEVTMAPQNSSDFNRANSACLESK